MIVRYLSEAQLTGFKNYKYSAIDTSPVSKYISHPFWNVVVEYVPKWIAPNVLTFVGFMFCVANYALLAYYDFDFYASSDLSPQTLPVPALVWLLCAIFQFLSHTLDGIDGKQARRTDSSGPLGELFDHGLDSWTTLFLSSALISVYGREDYSIPMYRIYFLVIAIHVVFLLSHFEKYNTGILYLPWSYDISQFGFMIIYLATFLFGYKVWKFHVPFTSLNIGNCIELSVYSGGFFLSLPITIYNIYMSYKNKTGKMHSTYEMLRPLVSTFLLCLLGTTWMFMSDSNIISHHPRLFFFMTGTIFSNILCRLIVSQMSNTRCELFNWSLLPLFMMATTVVVTPLPLHIEYYLLAATTILVTLAHIHYCCIVVHQMSEFFDIPVFTLKRKSVTD